MLFNSFPFVFCFLPIVLIGYQLAGRLHRRGVVLWLGIASLGFYAYWHPPFLIVLGTSIAANYLFATLISRRIPNPVDTRIWLWLAIVANLGALCYFKYLFPLLNFFSNALHTGHDWARVALPLGISFFTFTQIAYLVDLQQGAATAQDFSSYLLFVSFFPHLIAGPILHHKDIMPQFQEQRDYRLKAEDLAVGFSWFIMGLFKKVILADQLARFVDPVYATVGGASMTQTWQAVLSYALQLYFDFSGYSDMALGLARMFSIQFPLNFSSPYKSTNIIDFWGRWHMTLTQYITYYLFTPVQMIIVKRRLERGLKANRKALSTPSGFIQMITLPMLFTMGIAGVWHGAGLQFIIFGLLHGVYLTAAHGWRTLRASRPELLPAWIGPGFRHVFSVGLTFSAVVLAEIFFRAADTRTAIHVVRRMAGFYAVHGPAPLVPANIYRQNIFLLPLGLFIVWFLPNTQQILANFNPSLGITEWDKKPGLFHILWQPTARWAIILSIAFFYCLVHFEDPSTFLYFQF